jgi:hypothetical protein
MKKILVTISIMLTFQHLIGSRGVDDPRDLARPRAQDGYPQNPFETLPDKHIPTFRFLFQNVCDFAEKADEGKKLMSREAYLTYVEQITAQLRKTLPPILLNLKGAPLKRENAGVSNAAQLTIRCAIGLLPLQQAWVSALGLSPSASIFQNKICHSYKAERRYDDGLKHRGPSIFSEVALVNRVVSRFQLVERCENFYALGAIFTDIATDFQDNSGSAINPLQVLSIENPYCPVSLRRSPSLPSGIPELLEYCSSEYGELVSSLQGALNDLGKACKQIRTNYYS